ncbi:MAG: bacillithiol biosynthesis deacetylase BshB1 [Bacteroidota bacterium]
MNKVDILAFGAHPDDVELSCSGTVIKHIKNGKKVGIIDLTNGELGTRGTPEIRLSEAEAASKIMGVAVREQLNMMDGYFDFSEANKLAIVRMIRKYKPEIVLANAITDRHPDHGRAAKLVSESCFLAGLRKVVTLDENNQSQPEWRPKVVYHYIQDRYIKPDFIVDITPYLELKMQAIKAFSSQFYNPESNEPITPIATKEFLDFLEARAGEFGRAIGVKYAEGFTTDRPVGVHSFFDLI